MIRLIFVIMLCCLSVLSHETVVTLDLKGFPTVEAVMSSGQRLSGILEGVGSTYAHEYDKEIAETAKGALITVVQGKDRQSLILRTEEMRLGNDSRSDFNESAGMRGSWFVNLYFIQKGWLSPNSVSDNCDPAFVEKHQALSQLIKERDRYIRTLDDDNTSRQSKLETLIKIRAIGYHGKEATDSVIKLLSGKDKDLSVNAMAALTRITPNRELAAKSISESLVIAPTVALKALSRLGTAAKVAERDVVSYYSGNSGAGVASIVDAFLDVLRSIGNVDEQSLVELKKMSTDNTKSAYDRARITEFLKLQKK